MKKILFIIAIILLYFCTDGLNAQTQNKVTSALAVKNSGKDECTITFTCASPVNNVLVVMFDEQGNTVFLDNRYRFSGEYKKNVSLKGLKPGIYTVQVKNDLENYSASLTFE